MICNLLPYNPFYASKNKEGYSLKSTERFFHDHKPSEQGYCFFSISETFHNPERTLPVEDLDFRLAHAYDQLLQDKGFSLGYPITVRGQLVIREPFDEPRIEPRDLKTYTTPHFSTLYTPSQVELIPRYVHKL